MLAKAFKLLRTSHEYKQHELADLMDVSISHISEIESGKKKPSFELIQKYSEVFDIPVSSIMFFAERIENPDGTIKEADSLQKAIAGKIINFLCFMEDKANTCPTE